MKVFNSKFILWIIPVIFLLVALLTINDYGHNWDESYHFTRGQAYLHYFLTGKKNFDDLPEYSRNSTSIPRRSFFQHPTRQFDWFIEVDSTQTGHPPLNGILSALGNKIFYQYLGLFGDVESHHIFSIVTSALTVLLVGVWAAEAYGTFAGVIAGLALATYPLLFEMHFNIKDPPLAFFFAATLYFFWKGITQEKARWIILSAIAAGFGLGTKFNILFAGPIMGVWLGTYLIDGLTAPFLEKTRSALLLKISSKFSSRRSVLDSHQPNEKIPQDSRSESAKCFSRKVPQSAWHIIGALILFIPIMFGVLYLSWPFLWQDPVGNLQKVIHYYQDIGAGTKYQPDSFFFHGWNTYPWQWIFYTTPLVTLGLFVIGFLAAAGRIFKEKRKTSLLILLWFLLPILRVSYPGTTIYGGVRQIMEFLPALAMLAGLGAARVATNPPTRRVKNFLNPTGFSLAAAVRILIVLSFIPITLKLISLHPNENVYFNPLIGGLKGAYERNFPSWGTNMGNVYLQGIKWLNENAEKEARVGVLLGTQSNLADPLFREDILHANWCWSGPLHNGEYEMELINHGPEQWYSFAYYETFLEPVHIVEAEGVPLLKIWKNDAKYLKKGYEEEIEITDAKTHADTESAEANLGKDYFVTRLEISYPTEGCENTLAGGWVQISSDGRNWQREVEQVDAEQVNLTKNLPKGKFVWYFAAKKARLVTVKQPSPKRCILQNPTIRVFALQKG